MSIAEARRPAFVPELYRRPQGPSVSPRPTTMVSQMLSYLQPVRVTVAYAVLLVVLALTQTAFGPRVHNAVVSHMSTNLHNLSHGHLGTLVGSAFVTDGGDIYFMLPGLMCLLALGELVWRSGHLVLAFALGHIGATLIVAAGLAVAIEARWLPMSIAHASDVGVSYGAAAVLGALMAAIPRRWQPGWAGWWLAVALVGASGAGFTGVGHAVALLLGMGLSLRLGSAARWTPPRVVLLAVAVAFGFGMITGSSPATAAVAAPAGLLVALIAQRGAPRLPKLRSVMAQPARIAPATETLRPSSLDLTNPAVGAPIARLFQSRLCRDLTDVVQQKVSTKGSMTCASGSGFQKEKIMTFIDTQRVSTPNGPAMLHARAHAPNALAVAEIVQAGIGLPVPLVVG